MDAERFLTNIITTMSSSPDFRTSIPRLACLATDDLADWCGIYLFESEQTIRRVAVSPGPQVEALFPIDLQATTGPAYVRRTSEIQMILNPNEVLDERLGLKSEDLVLPAGGTPSMYACIPAIAGQQTIGAVAYMRAKPKRGLDEKDLSLATSLANAAAVAMENLKLYRTAHEASRLKDEFVAMVSHELRTPLTPMLGCIHLLRTTNPNSANFDRALEMIERNARTQVQIVEDLLDVSRIVAGNLHLSMKSIAVIPVVEAAIDAVKSSAEAKGIKTITSFEDVRIPIAGDPHRLQQIVWNLLSNAVKFTPAEGRIEISVRSVGTHVQVQVTDTGEGIPADILPYIFDRFRQSRDPNSKIRSGLGLGLAIVRHLVELHSGSIEAASAGPGKGAVFTLCFPFAAVRVATKVGGNSGTDV
jgi:signal transduction histidine kinase